ncbi:sensory rhodopsin transducer [Paenibacillus algicola]|uniref:sensory rhodopsin transducer n=1 Tax=Paenibacillus algicola TaxID=2565926 RepID=UPI0010FEDB54|nr:sensory rhodopsin transducer [Paenibacillus algicola]
MCKGKTHWIIPDGYIPPTSSGELVSHESVCVLNLNADEITVTINAYFEDREPILGMNTQVPGQRTRHIRTAHIESSSGVSIPAGVPYAMEVIASKPAFVQYSRLDSTQAENALMSVMAYSVDKD